MVVGARAEGPPPRTHPHPTHTPHHTYTPPPPPHMKREREDDAVGLRRPLILAMGKAAKEG